MKIRLLGALCLLCAAMSLRAPSAQADDTTLLLQANGTLELIDQSSFVAADGVLETTLRWTGLNNPNFELSATIWAAIGSETEIFSEPSEVLHRVGAKPLGEFERTGDGDILFSIPIRSFRSAEDERKFLPSEGVYPITFELRNQSGELARLRTNLIRLPTDVVDVPLLPISILLNVSSADGLELGEAIQLLEVHPTLPITVLLEDGVLPQLESDADLAGTLRSALGERRLVSGVQRDLDPSALAGIDQPNFYLAALAETHRRFIEVGLRLDQTVLPLETSITAPGANLLSDAGIETVIDVRTSPGSTGLVPGTSGRLTVLRVDADYTARLAVNGLNQTRTDGALQQAHRLIALLSVRYQQDRSPVVLGGGELRTADLTTLEVVLGSLDQGGILEAIPLAQAATSFRRLPFRLEENPDQNLTDVADSILHVQQLTRTYADFRVVGGPSPEGIESRLGEGLSRDFNPNARASAIANIAADIEAEFDVISLPESPAITLAAQRSAIPLTITNDSSGSRQIRLIFESDRIDVAEHDQLVTVMPGKSQVEITIEARSLGVSTLVLHVVTPDGTTDLASTSFEIRSTAIPGLGYALSGTALVFLIIWWIRSISRGRAARRNDSEDQPLPADSEKTQPADASQG